MERVSDEKLAELIDDTFAEVLPLDERLTEACVEEVRDALNELQELRSQSRWVKVSPDTMPKVNHGVLVWCPEILCEYLACWTDGGWKIFGGDKLKQEVTHWMESPAAPKEGENGQ